ncbi:E4 protein [human papillomavirus 103]|uniref:E4 protein n=1 Tax=human papillomavirus 103 TaxID=338323 RepID=Q1AHT3_9PAPI|nr:E4 protein [human papillomavirus 103]AAZ39488.1 E4 protein [human papillomavirus 103]CAD1807600.1 E4 protein [human papillomavirus 103]
MYYLVLLLSLALRRGPSKVTPPHKSPEAPEKANDEDIPEGKPPRPPRRPQRPTQRIRLPNIEEESEDTENENDPSTGGTQVQNLLLTLLQQWDRDIEALIETIRQDLQGYKRRLGIPQYY